MSIVKTIAYMLASTLIMTSTQANIVFDFTGNNAKKTQAKAVLTLKDSYVLGTDITSETLVSLSYRSKEQTFTISPSEVTNSIYAALNADGSLAHSSGNYQFYLDASSNKLLGVRTNGTWTAYQHNSYEDGSHGKWTLRIATMKNACRTNDNFHKAAANGDTTYLAVCLKAGFPINQTERHGWTALHSAVQNRQIKSVRFLLSRGASTQIKTKRNQTPYELANSVGASAIAALLRPKPRK